MLEHRPDTNSRITVTKGIVVGIFVFLPAIALAFISAGAGHGDYGAARALFPLPMLLTFGGSIGIPSLSVALLQFPIYGALFGWSISRKKYSAIVLLAIFHLAAVAACFSGTLPNFSPD